MSELRQQSFLPHTPNRAGFFWGLRGELKKNGNLYLLAIPGLVYLVVFAYLPMFGHMVAFKDFKASLGLLRSPWVGFDHFRYFFLSEIWVRVTWNTIYLNALQIFFGTIIAVTTALLLNEIRVLRVKKVAQSFIFLPYFISWIVVSYMVFAMLSTREGMLNNVFELVGRDRISFYSEPGYWPAIITTIHVWKSVGQNSIVYLAVIAGISGDYYEGAIIDGANRFQRIWHITLPMMKPTIILLTLLAVGKIFYGDFGLIYPIVGDNGLLFPTTDVIDTYVYRGLRTNFAGSAAIALWQSVMGLAIITSVNALARRVDDQVSLW